MLCEAVDCELLQRKRTSSLSYFFFLKKNKHFRFIDERQRACSLMAQAVELASKMPDLQNSLPHGF